MNGACESAHEILLVGEDNPLSMRNEHALYPYPLNCAGNRLQEKIFQVSMGEYLQMWRTNLCVGGWRVKQAREAATAIINALTAREVTWKVIVLLGQKVQTAFSQVGDGPVPENFSSRPVTIPPTRAVSFTLASLPHPSGRNRIWNQEWTIKEAQMLMKKLVPGIAWGA